MPAAAIAPPQIAAIKINLNNPLIFSKLLRVSLDRPAGYINARTPRYRVHPLGLLQSVDRRIPMPIDLYLALGNKDIRRCRMK